MFDCQEDSCQLPIVRTVPPLGVREALAEESCWSPFALYQDVYGGSGGDVACVGYQLYLGVAWRMCQVRDAGNVVAALVESFQTLGRPGYLGTVVLLVTWDESLQRGLVFGGVWQESSVEIPHVHEPAEIFY